MVEMDSGDVLAMRDGRFNELLDEINAKQKQIRYATMFAVAMGAVGLGVVFLSGPIGGFVLLLALPAWAIGWWLDSYKRRSVLFYNLEGDASKAYQAVTEAFDQLVACAGKWHIEAKGAIHDLTTWKRNAGATSLVNRKAARLTYATPKVIASNITPPSIEFGRQTIYFFPDSAFVVDGKGVGAIGYDDLSILNEESAFIENESVPADAKVISHTWKYPNKDGGPDRRFSNNVQIPVCLYELAQFGSSTGLNELLEFSRTGVVSPFAAAIKNLARSEQPTAFAPKVPQPKPSEERPATQQLDLALVRKLLADTKADFFRRFKESPNLSKELIDLRETVFTNFDYLVTAVLCTIASVDGPINGKEAEVMNTLLGVQQSASSYNEFLKSVSTKVDISNLFEKIVDVAIQLEAVEQGKEYDPKNDSIVRCVKAIGEATLLADGNASQSELASLSSFITVSESKAAEIAFRTRSGDGRGDTASNSTARQ
jgi:hypothetical protein